MKLKHVCKYVPIISHAFLKNLYSKSLKCFISSAYWSAYAYFQCWESKLIFISWNLKWLFEKNSIRALIYLWMNTPKLYWPQRLILLFHIIKLFDAFCLKPCVTLRVTQRVTQFPNVLANRLIPLKIKFQSLCQ